MACPRGHPRQPGRRRTVRRAGRRDPSRDLRRCQSTTFPLPSSPHCAPTIATAVILGRLWRFVEDGEYPISPRRRWPPSRPLHRDGDALRTKLGEAGIVGRADDHDAHDLGDRRARRAQRPGQAVESTQSRPPAWARRSTRAARRTARRRRWLAGTRRETWKISRPCNRRIRAPHRGRRRWLPSAGDTRVLRAIEHREELARPRLGGFAATSFSPSTTPPRPPCNRRSGTSSGAELQRRRPVRPSPRAPPRLSARSPPVTLRGRRPADASASSARTTSALPRSIVNLTRPAARRASAAATARISRSPSRPPSPASSTPTWGICRSFARGRCADAARSPRNRAGTAAASRHARRDHPRHLRRDVGAERSDLARFGLDEAEHVSPIERSEAAFEHLRELEGGRRDQRVPEEGELDRGRAERGARGSRPPPGEDRACRRAADARASGDGSR